MWTIIALSILCALLLLVIIKQCIVTLIIKRNFSSEKIRQLLKTMIKANFKSIIKDKNDYIKVEFLKIKSRKSLWLREQHYFALCAISYNETKILLNYYMMLANDDADNDLIKKVKKFIILDI